tara:strand:+ start:3225 stop:3683 length:459 start_codon:yes stop_codon:yes gene_type:complete
MDLVKLLDLSPKMESTNFQEVVDKISQSRGSGETKDDTKFFNNNWKAFVMAALIGFKKKISRKLVGDSKNLKKDTFKFLQIYNGDPNLLKLLIMNVIAIHGYDVLKDRTKILNSIEEHANGGLDFMHDKIKKDDTFLSDVSFLDFMNEYVES